MENSKLDPMMEVGDKIKIDEEMFNTLSQMVLSKDKNDHKLFRGIIVNNYDNTDKETMIYIKKLAILMINNRRLYE